MSDQTFGILIISKNLPNIKKKVLVVFTNTGAYNTTKAPPQKKS